jgi:hypothetical protein
MSNTKKTRKTKVQTIYSEPRRIKVKNKKYFTKSGQRKEKYVDNPNAMPIKTITHPLPHAYR